MSVSHRHILPYAREDFVVATAAIPRYTAVGLNHESAGAAADIWGVTHEGDHAVGDCYSVVMMGTCVIRSGGVVAVGAQVETDASGRAVAGNTNVIGRALSAAGAADENIEILLADLTK